MYRTEYKYYLPISCLDSLRKAILPYMVFDPYLVSCNKKEYTVSSVYFDSPNMMCYHEKLAGLEQRLKFRIRSYGAPDSDSQCFIEIKRKQGDFIDKDRAPILFKNIRNLLTDADYSLILPRAGKAGETKVAASNFLYYYKSRFLQPKVLVVYDREPFECKFGSGLRLTFDKALRTNPALAADYLTETKNMLFPLNNLFILEIKYYSVLPAWLSQVLTPFSLLRTAASKYTLSVDAVTNRYSTAGIPV